MVAAYMSDVYDVIVIGAGPSRLSSGKFEPGRNKLKVACVDEWQNTDGSYGLRRKPA